MAVNQRLLQASPERVFDVLMNAAAYADWVVGSDAIRDTDENWPQVGSRFHHRVGAGPFKLNDHTTMLENVPLQKVVLHARGRPFGTALVTIALQPQGNKTLVTMSETAGDLMSHIGINPLTDWLVHLRNNKALGRLARIAETGVVKR
jgi:uncharacterized protein YndB with AHSA1/START domain